MKYPCTFTLTNTLRVHGRRLLAPLKHCLQGSHKKTHPPPQDHRRALEIVLLYRGTSVTSARGSVGRRFLILRKPRAKPVGLRSLSRKRKKAVGPLFLTHRIRSVCVFLFFKKTGESGRGGFLKIRKRRGQIRSVSLVYVSLYTRNPCMVILGGVGVSYERGTLPFPTASDY